MITVNTNMSGIIARNSLSKATGSLNNALQRMSTGYKINSSKDDAAGMAISNKLEYKKSSFNVAYKNAQMGQSMLETANGSLSNINDMLHRMRDLAEQASNGTYGKDERKAMQTELDALKNEIYRIKDTTEFNDKKLFDVPDDSTTNGTATLSNTNANKPVTLSAVSNNGIDTYAGEISMADVSASNWANTAGKTITISSGAELQKLAELTNLGNDTTGRTFKLTADIDMAEEGITNFTPIGSKDYFIGFKGSFDGQGYTISNLTVDSNKDYSGLFGYVEDATISNLTLDNANIKGNKYVGGVVGHATNSNIKNCFVNGKIYGTGELVGGLVGQIDSDENKKSTVQNCNTSANINGSGSVGGLIGYASGAGTVEISDSSSDGKVIATAGCGGFIGCMDSSGTIIKNCSSNTTVTSEGSQIGGFAGAIYYGSIISCQTTGNIESSSYNRIGGFAGFAGNIGKDANLENNEYKNDKTVGGDKIPAVGNAEVNDSQIKYNPSLKPTPRPTPPTPTPTPSGSGSETNLQIGIGSDDNSVIKVDTGFALGDINISLATDFSSRQALDTIDALIAKVTDKMTSIGATQNRIESAMQYQVTQINALTASNSLIKDADIAKESANYIKSQILQNVASSLLSTANQAPSIALNLI